MTDDTIARAAAGADRSTPPRRVRLAVPGGIANFAHLPSYLARDLGLFAARGLDVDIVKGESGFACLGMVQAGDVDVAWTSTVGMLRAAERGEAEHIRMTLSPFPGLDIQIGALPGITRCEDFAGQPVAVQGPGTFTHAMLDVYLSGCGLRIDHDVEQVNASPDDFGALLAESRAVGCAAHADDLALIRHFHCPQARSIANAWDLLPQFHYASYVMTAQLRETEPAAGAAFVDAALEATSWLIDPANRDEVIRRAAEVTTQPIEVIRDSYELYIDRFTTDCRGSVPDAMLEATAQHQVSLGIMSTVPRPEEVVDRSLCDRRP